MKKILLLSLLFLNIFSIKGFTFAVEVLKVIERDDRRQFLKYPVNVKVDQEHFNIYVVDSSRNRLILYNFNYYPYFALGGERGIINPQAVDIDENGYIYVLQTSYFDKPLRLSIFNSLGLLEREIPFNKEDFNINFTSLAVDSKYIYLVSSSTPGVLILDKKTGNIVKKIKILDVVASTLKEVTLSDVYVDRRGRVYFLSEEAGRFYVYDSRLNFLFKGGEKGGTMGKLSRPRAIAASPELNLIIVIDYMRHTGLVYDYKDGSFKGEFGGRGWLPGWFQGPMDVDVDREGRIYVADTFNGRVQVITLRSGDTKGIYRPSFITPLQPVK